MSKAYADAVIWAARDILQRHRMIPTVHANGLNVSRSGKAMRIRDLDFVLADFERRGLSVDGAAAGIASHALDALNVPHTITSRGRIVERPAPPQPPKPTHRPMNMLRCK